MTVSIIAAMSRNRVIGRQGAIPWDIPEDRRRFRELTFGHALIMGRRTFESIGRPLPGRKNIIVTGQADYSAAGCLTAASLAEAIRLAEPSLEVFICGGSELYRQTLPFAARIYLTVIQEYVAGDTTFPAIPDAFEVVASEKISAVPEAIFTVYMREPQRPLKAADEDH